MFLTLTASLPALRPDKCPQSSECKAQRGVPLAVLYAALYTIALGAGGIKPNVAAFGADQFDRNDSRESRQLTTFFTAFFFFISIGAVISVTVLVWVQVFNLPTSCLACLPAPTGGFFCLQSLLIL